MTERMAISDLEAELTALSDRVSDLRQARASYPGDIDGVLDAALVELAAAEDLIRACLTRSPGSGERGRRRGSPAEREYRLLKQVFRTLPVPTFLLDAQGAVRRVNPEAAAILGTPAGYLTGKPFALFVDLPRRAAFRSRLSEVLRDATTVRFDSRLAKGTHVSEVRLSLTMVNIPGEPHPMIAVAAALTEPGPARTAPVQAQDDEEGLAVVAARRLDVMTRMTRLLLDEESLHEPVAVGRAARLLAGTLADWVLIDVHRDGVLRRAVVVGPRDQPVSDLVRRLTQLDPGDAPMVREVAESGGSALHELPAEDTMLGVADGERPVLPLLDASSVIGVPLREQSGSLGVLTLVRTGQRTPFNLADLGLLEDIGENIARALTTERTFRSRAESARSLQAGMLPRTLPAIPGLDLADDFRAGDGVLVGGDFYDIFPARDGWGFVFGNVLGRGGEAVEIASLVRHAVRVLSLSEGCPTEILRRVNEALEAGPGSGRGVAVLAGLLRPAPGSASVRMACAGHHPPALLRADTGVRPCSGGGLPLGVSADAEVAAEDITLADGDALVLCSHGLIESRDDSGEVYGDTRLPDVLARSLGLAAAPLVKAVQDDRDQFAGGRLLEDVTLLALRVRSGG
ncbi:SpoIIE family protein phosphatase [Rhizohabitans arisaemae]|uniref:SpoIIE family protein phosphatase n=1 Tax=Rhizohabitans arisaemae TaxID=2720610 RepID=UPI0024B09FEE|nr:SpoIIE family protein phosphatase [Rhizohabitans arisaemae]